MQPHPVTPNEKRLLHHRPVLTATCTTSHLCGNLTRTLYLAVTEKHNLGVSKKEGVVGVFDPKLPEMTANQKNVQNEEPGSTY